MLLLDYLKGLGEWYAFSPALARAVGGLNEGVLLQFLIWRTRGDDPVAVTQDEIEQATCLTRYQQEAARRRLVAQGIIEERHEGLPRRLTYRVNADALEAAWSAKDSACGKLADKSAEDEAVSEKPALQSAENSQTGMRETRKHSSFLEEEKKEEVVVVDASATTSPPSATVMAPERPQERREVKSAPFAYLEVWNAWKGSTASPSGYPDAPSLITEQNIKTAIAQHGLELVLKAARAAARDPFWRGELPEARYPKGRPHPQKGLTHAMREVLRYAEQDELEASRPVPQAPRYEPPEDMLSSEEAAALLSDLRERVKGGGS